MRIIGRDHCSNEDTPDEPDDQELQSTDAILPEWSSDGRDVKHQKYQIWAKDLDRASE
ncbi:MAG: hypothetical protein IPF93_21995, partial [Saprospiraceae bacterium]|nr:hypothetical protein [Saprospiraceae bacterium]